MNFDRFNPLSSYLSSYGAPSAAPVPSQEPQSSIPPAHQSNAGTSVSGADDWGIEENVSTPSVSQHNYFTNQLHPIHSISSNPHLEDFASPQFPQYGSHHGNFQYPQHNNYQHSHHSHQHYEHSLQYHYEHKDQPDFSYYYKKYTPHPIEGNTDNFSKFIFKYLTLDKIEDKFWEKFKYNLVTSDLLDDTMILSKNEQAFTALEATLSQQKQDHDHRRTTLVSTLNFDGSQLEVLEKQYRLKYSGRYGNMNYIILVINMIMYLLKQQQRVYLNKPAIPHHSQMKMFKVTLIIASKLIKYKKFKLLVMSQRNLALLNQFLLSNFDINKRLIQKLIALKELEVFYYINRKVSQKEKAERESYKHDLRSHLGSSLHFLILCMRTSISKLLPYLNGDLFEKYCSLNNIDIHFLTIEYEVDDSEMTEPNSSNHSEYNSLDEIVFNMNKFNQLRKLFICQLLTLNESPVKHNFFTYTLMDQFPGADVQDDLSMKDLMKMTLLKDIFEEHNQTSNTFISLFKNFESINRDENAFGNKFSMPQENQDILTIKSNQLHANNNNDTSEEYNDTNLVTLINKLSNLTTNLKYFQKYNKSTTENIDELNEKLMIFNKFNDDLQAIKAAYSLNVKDLNAEIYQLSNQEPPSPSVSNSSLTSPRSSTISANGEFNLKSFHNSSIKKRFSLPVSVPPLKSPITSPVAQNIEAGSNDRISSDRTHAPEANVSSSSGKKYKRLSTGLQLGLLTVFEEPKQEGARPQNGNYRHSSGSNSGRRSGQHFLRSLGNAGGVSYDDNYVNILPPANYETYNQATYEQLSNNGNKKLSFTNFRNSNRFSLNSVNSNISGLTDLISSTQITSYDDDDIDGLVKGTKSDDKSQEISQEELKLKLEESFSRIYNLENENKILKLNKNMTNSDHDTIKYENGSVSEQQSNSNDNTHQLDNKKNCEKEFKLNGPFLSELERSLAHKISQNSILGNSEVGDEA
ncbi:Mysoin-binding motif of peroxisomes-domain-containing protein [Scheffersomyces xylosifermentans]|uniref:Mysoin-binding motif of peroxisomes-domain-containing protein n=1 Tax=Scheffersomyces xylosifermentans TaxID=1304137 RepID=UPI00315DF961